MAQLMSYEQMVEGAVVIADINLPFYAAGDFGWFERNLVFTERKDGSVYMGARSRDGIFSVRKMFGPDFGRRKVAEFILEITATTLAQDYVGIPVPTDDEEELGEAGEEHSESSYGADQREQRLLLRSAVLGGLLQ